MTFAFRYGDWVLLTNGFFSGSSGHILNFRQVEQQGEHYLEYEVLLDLPETVQIEHFLANAPSVTMWVTEKQLRPKGLRIGGGA